MKRTVRKKEIMSEINITPFTDVVLVLLIIFMIATPFIYQASMDVALPQASSSQESTRDIIVTINANGEIFFDNTQVDLTVLKEKLRAAIQGKPDTTVIVNGDRNARFDAVIQVLDVLTQAGVRNPRLGIELKR
jgi:biopolymer transport protein TolR